MWKQRQACVQSSSLHSHRNDHIITNQWSVAPPDGLPTCAGLLLLLFFPVICSLAGAGINSLAWLPRVQRLHCGTGEAPRSRCGSPTTRRAALTAPFNLTSNNLPTGAGFRTRFVRLWTHSATARETFYLISPFRQRLDLFVCFSRSIYSHAVSIRYPQIMGPCVSPCRRSICPINKVSGVHPLRTMNVKIAIRPTVVETLIIHFVIFNVL